MRPISQPLTLQPWSEGITEGATDQSGWFVTPPRVLYRYFGYTRALEVITTEKLYFSSPVKFNDPLDMNESLIEYKYDKEKLGKWYDRLSERERKRPKEEFISNALKSKGFYSHVRKMFVDFIENSGVCCFTPDPDNALMWSHYTESHKGIVLGFNIMPVMRGGSFFIQPVKYYDDIVPKNYFDGNEETLAHLILTKSSIWKYENEWRAYHYYNNGLFPFNKACLKEVIFGYHTPKGKRTEILTAIKKGGYKGITIKEIALDKSSFKFVTKEVKK